MRVHDGYHAKAGICRDGSWFAGIMQLRDADKDFIIMDPEGIDRQRKLLPGKTIDDWIEGCLDDPVTVSLLVEGEDTPQPLTKGLKIYPPTVPVESVETPVVVWCEADDDGYSLQIHSEGATRTVKKGSRIFANLSVCVHDGMPFVSYQTHLDDLSIVTEVCTLEGEVIHTSPGTSPRIRSTRSGILLIKEVCADSKIELKLVHLHTDGTFRFETTLNGYDDFNTHADVTIVGETAYVVWEASPAWGSEHYLGQHRNLACALVGLGASPGVVSIELLPIPKQVVRESQKRVFNLPPVYPSFIDRDEGITVAYRRFRPDRVQATGWDLFVIQKSDAPWSAPRRITKQYGNHDGGYTVLSRDNQFISFFPAIVNEGGSMPNIDYWLEIDAFDAERDLGDLQASYACEGDYLVPPPTRHPVLEHTRVAPTIPDLELIFGDMHRHSSAGRCMCARDGSAQEGIRFCRDILKNDILLLTDHHHHFSYADGAWYSLVLEQEAAGRPLRRIGLIRDGDILFWKELSGNEWKGVIEDESAPEGEHWYSIVVQGESVYTMGKACNLDEFKQSWCMAFCSPFFLDVIDKDPKG